MAFTLLVLLCAFSAACTSHKPEALAQTASINDLAPFWDEDIVNGSRWAFEVIAVNGRLPQRAQHPIATMIPYVVTPAGSYLLKVKTTRTPSADIKREVVEFMTVQATLEPGKHYRLAFRDGLLALVETSNSLNKN
ncbi:hypothetical protein CMV30_16730 [Nibricoccus aquaticus]|uniref:Uncharacterized protein n=2 Tax=Nibricoccus aquaticus TaxID=2576891 RepID=A0A290QB33_9BACT|nr:hypothetical protein CMV30_16730 [Nibricoccus aquaticus]